MRTLIQVYNSVMIRWSCLPATVDQPLALILFKPLGLCYYVLGIQPSLHLVDFVIQVVLRVAMGLHVELRFWNVWEEVGGRAAGDGGLMSAVLADCLQLLARRRICELYFVRCAADSGQVAAARM